MLAPSGISIACIKLGCDKKIRRASSVATKDADEPRLAERHTQPGCSDAHTKSDIGSDDDQCDTYWSRK